jgi:uncharacterized repeat protein (TIGR03806 family)
MRQVAAILCILLAAGCEPAQRDVQLFAADAPPGLLSEWGVFTINGDGLELNERVIPYELKTPLFSDYALKLRTVWMPAGESALYDPINEFDFPVGTIISKTFHYRKAADWAADNSRVLVEEQSGPNNVAPPLNLDEYLLIETRLLVRYADGWVGFPYVWNQAQTDAVLEIAGDVRPIQLSHGEDSGDLNYVVPDVNQCAGCHTPNHSDGELRPLGPKAWQLNRSYDWWDEGDSQVNHWRSHGLLREAPQLLPDETSDLDRAAREYLDANCAHCHNPAGAADTSALHLNIDAPVDRKLGVCKTPVAVGRGSGDLNYDIYPGRPDDSIMIFRMQHSDPAIAMPELGRSAVHVEGVKLVSEWIAAMSGEC